MNVTQTKSGQETDMLGRRLVIQKEAGVFSVNFAGSGAMLTVNLFDMAGRTIASRTGLGPVRIPFASMPRGACVLRVMEGYTQVSERILTVD